MTVLRVLLADDDPMLMEHMVRHLSAVEDIEVVGTADNGADALGLLRRMGLRDALSDGALSDGALPDIVLLDIDMPGQDGVATAGRIAEDFPAVTVVMYTVFARAATLDAALAAGAKGFVTKDTPVAQIADVLRRAHAGETVMDARPTDQMVAQYRRHLIQRTSHAPFEDAVAQLSVPLREVFDLMTTAASNREIERHTGLATSTVKDYAHRVLQQTGCDSRTQLVLKAAQSGLTWNPVAGS